MKNNVLITFETVKYSNQYKCRRHHVELEFSVNIFNFQEEKDIEDQNSDFNTR